MSIRLFITLFVFCVFASTLDAQLTNLPSIYITTDNGVDPYSKTEYLLGRIVVKSSEPSEDLDMITEIRCRGNSTFNAAKKPYRLKLDKKTNLLNNKANAKSWVLLANFLEGSLIRNAVAFKISELFEMDFSPSVRFVDLYMNGNYAGNYMLTDQVEVREHRVPVEEQTLGAESDISGGYLIEIDGFAGGEPVTYRTNQWIPVTVKYPDDDEITGEQYTYIKDFTNRFEDLLFSENFADPEIGFRSMVDEKSVVNWYLICELTGNPDSFWSTYLYKHRNEDRFHFGPVWDFDIAFNNDSRLGNATRKLMRVHAHEYRQWIQQMWRAEWFRQAVKDRWKEILEQGILENVLTYIDNLASEIADSQALDAERWSKYVDWDNEIGKLKDYMTARVDFLTEEFNSNPDPITPFDPESYYCFIKNSYSGLLIDVISELAPVSNLTLRLEKEDYNTQLWEFIAVGDYYQIINKYSGSAIIGNGHGNRIRQVEPDKTNDSQLWKIEETSVSGVYAIVNKASGYAIDNSSGGTTDGTPVIEWDNDSQRNENQQWILRKTEEIEPSVGIDRITDRCEEAYYAVYTIDGKCVISNHIKMMDNNQIELSIKDYGLTQGVYLLRLTTQEGSHTSKFIVR